MIQSNLSTGRWMVAVVVLILGTSAVLAGGFYVSAIGTPSSVGTAGSGNVTIDDTPDAAWTNPAGMTGLDQATIFSGIQILVPNIRFDPDINQARGGDGGQAGERAGIPSLFWVQPLSDDWRFGLSVTAPLGGGFDFGDDWAGRYAIQRISLAGLAVSPSVGVRLTDKVSLGFGASIVYTDFEEDLAIAQPMAPDAQARIQDADDIGVQGFVGLQYRLSEKATFGIVYRSKLDTDLEGDLSINGLVLPVDPKSDLTLSWDNAQLLEIGFRYKVSKRWGVAASADWEDWSQFSENVLAVEETPSGRTVAVLDRKWKDTYQVNMGAMMEYGVNRLTFGIGYDSSPVDDEDRTLDLPMDEQVRLSMYYGRVEGGKLDWGIGAMLLWMGDGEVDQVSQVSAFNPEGIRISGEFDHNTILFLSGTLRYIF